MLAVEVISMYSDDEIELPEWVINDPWLQELDAWVWFQLEKQEDIANL